MPSLKYLLHGSGICYIPQLFQVKFLFWFSLLDCENLGLFSRLKILRALPVRWNALLCYMNQERWPNSKDIIV